MILVIFAIAYGSLYPWDFIFVAQTSHPVWILLHSWPGDDFPTIDVLVNIALYVPLGAAAYMAFRERYCKVIAGVTAISLGLCLSTGIELLQVYDPLRYPSALDVITNGCGSCVGVFTAGLFTRGLRLLNNCYRLQLADPAALALLVLWIAVLVAPFFPEAGPSAILHKFAIFWKAPFSFSTFAFYCASWLIAGELMKACVPSPGLHLWAATLLLPLQTLWVTRQPSSAEFLGAICGCVLHSRWNNRAYAASLTVYFYLLMLVLEGCIPLNGQPVQSFDWVPFAGILDAEPSGNGILVLLKKVVGYGGVIWVWRNSGMSINAAALRVATVLTSIEALQIYVPGATPEITDPMIGVLTAYGIRALDQRRESTTDGRLQYVLHRDL